MTAAETDIPLLAHSLGLGRAPLVDLVQGRVVVPAPIALLANLADALRTTIAAVDAATRAAVPRIGMAKADVDPSFGTHSRSAGGDPCPALPFSPPTLR